MSLLYTDRYLKSFAFCSRGMILLCLIFKFSLLQQLSSLALFYFLNLYSFMLSSNQCCISIRDYCLDQRGALVHFVYRYFASYSALPFSKAVGKSLRQHVYDLPTHMFALSVFDISAFLYFFLRKMHLHDFFTLYTLLGSLLTIVYIPAFIYLAPFYYLSVGHVSHSLQLYLIGRR